MVLYRNEQGGFACLALLKIVWLFIGVIELIVENHVYREGTTSGNKEGNTINAMHNMMHDHDMAICCGLG